MLDPTGERVGEGLPLAERELLGRAAAHEVVLVQGLVVPGVELAREVAEDVVVVVRHAVLGVAHPDQPTRRVVAELGPVAVLVDLRRQPAEDVELGGLGGQERAARAPVLLPELAAGIVVEVSRVGSPEGADPVHATRLRVVHGLLRAALPVDARLVHEQAPTGLVVLELGLTHLTADLLAAKLQAARLVVNRFGQPVRRGRSVRVQGLAVGSTRWVGERRPGPHGAVLLVMGDVVPGALPVPVPGAVAVLVMAEQLMLSRALGHARRARVVDPRQASEGIVGPNRLRHVRQRDERSLLVLRLPERVRVVSVELRLLAAQGVVLSSRAFAKSSPRPLAPPQRPGRFPPG